MAGRTMQIAVVGGGAAGAAAAALLAEQGAAVTLFHDGRRPPLVVGESLVPAVIPIFRRLGIEDAVRDLGMLKPGVSFAWGPDDVFRYEFQRFARGEDFPPYAYNVPRPAFDELILARAERGGVHVVRERASVVAGPGDTVGLAAITRQAGGYRDGAPDLVVDATGRARTVARLLGLASRRGPRDDVAHFAHFTGWRWHETPGQVLISRLRAGWSWCIPLGERLSIGIVVGRADAAALGDDPEARLARALRDDPALAPVGGADLTRVSPVLTYSNYQLVSERGHGPGWVLVGDAFGFVDPMLSPGVFLALRSAELLAAGLAAVIARVRDGGSPLDAEPELDRYAATVEHDLEAWMELVDSIYEGRLFGLQRAGMDLRREHDNVATRAMDRHIGFHIAGMASGVRTTSRYSRGLIRFLARHGMRGVAPRDFAVR